MYFLRTEQGKKMFIVCSLNKRGVVFKFPYKKKKKRRRKQQALTEESWQLSSNNQKADYVFAELHKGRSWIGLRRHSWTQAH